MKKAILIIRDGWGHGAHTEGNAIAHAHTPNHDTYKEKYPSAVIQCTGNAVGNPEGVQGGSEVGHLTMGAGRIVWQPYELINQAIKNGEFFQNEELLSAIAHCKTEKSSLHLNGLFSDQGIHADYRHMIEILELCKQQNFENVYIHLTLDGRDVPERSALGFLEKLEEELTRIGIGKIASLAGRYYTMDRDTNWDRTRKAYESMVDGKGFTASSARKAIEEAYKRGDKTDYYVQPTVIMQDGSPVASVTDGDAFIWYNFRSDRSRQITQMFNHMPEAPDDVTKVDVYYVCMSSYDSKWNLPVAFQQEEVNNNLGETIGKRGLKQLRIAETEKYAHVTFFFNSQKEEPNKGEQRMLVPSPKVPSYDQKPEMSAYEITEKLLPEIGAYDLIVVNFANPDLVGHSGVFDAAVRACEVVDECVGKVIDTALEEDYAVLLMADHGNADHMKYEDGSPDPSHGFNPVLMHLIGAQNADVRDGGMKDIAPTVLDIMGIDKPDEMSGESLLIRR